MPELLLPLSIFLAEMAVVDPTGFDTVVAAVRKALGLPEPAAVA